jgi:hypothetical protein
MLPPLVGQQLMKLTEKYRAKALACEKLAQEPSNYDLRSAWAEIAIEWHALAFRRYQEINQGRETELDIS